MMNIIIGALTTSAKLTACLAVLLILIIIEIATFLVLFIWELVYNLADIRQIDKFVTSLGNAELYFFYCVCGNRVIK